MWIANVRPWHVEISATGDYVDPHGVVEVDDDLAESLLEQPANWREAHPCDECTYVAKNAAGLAAHQRTHSPEDDK